MTVANASTELQAQWIVNHAIPGPRSFECFGQDYQYYLLTQEPDNDMRYWLGYNGDLPAFFVTSLNSMRLEQHLLRMECERLFHSEDHTHLLAVQRALQKSKGKFRTSVLEFLLRFYQEYADKFESTNDAELSCEERDIIKTAKHLKSLRG